MTKEEFIKRLKSFLWRAGAVALIAVLNYTLDNIGGFGFPVWLVGAVGLGLGEVTKYLNKKHQLKKA